MSQNVPVGPHWVRLPWEPLTFSRGEEKGQEPAPHIPALGSGLRRNDVWGSPLNLTFSREGRRDWTFAWGLGRLLELRHVFGHLEVACWS